MFNGSGWGHPLALVQVARAQGVLEPERSALRRCRRAGRRPAGGVQAGGARRVARRALAAITQALRGRPVEVAG